MIGAAIIELILSPTLKTPCTNERSLTGNHSVLFFTALGQFPASANPKSPLKMPTKDLLLQKSEVKTT